VTIHVEPQGPHYPTEPDREGIAVQLRRLADESQLGIHNVWAVQNAVDGRYHAEAHLEVDGTLSLREAHALASALEGRARAEIPDLVELTTHIEPQGQLIRPAQPGLGEMQVAQAVGRIAGETLDAGACHQIQVRQSGEGWAVSMHCRLPGDVLLAEAHRIITRLEAQLQEQVPGLERVMIHAEPEEE
jgi:divalent metal cation (Fe/Co/Zn/Cd) transporter